MSVPLLRGIRALVFDAYGTLFDVHTAVGRHRGRVGADPDRLSALWRQKQLEYTWLRSLMGRYANFWHVTADALDFALETCAIQDPALRDDLLDAYLKLGCYEEVEAVLSTLRNRGFRLAILSNGSPDMLIKGTVSAGIGHLLDDIVSVEDVGIYKPDPRVYQLACDRLDVSAEEICFQSSNAWDAAGASAFGFRVVWINRFGQRPERLPGRPDGALDSLRGLPDLLAAE
jgi:2-haloacid dehalogenase